MTTYVESDFVEEELKGGLGTSVEMLAQFCEDAGVLTSLRPKTKTNMDRLMELAMRKPEPTFREKPIEDRREYMRQKAQEHRDRKAAAKEAGKPVAQTPEIRAALADAALALLATDGPGAEQIRNYLFTTFPGMAGLPFTITAKAKQGKLKSK